MALTAFKAILKAIDHENFKQNLHHHKEEQRHAEKIKNIKQVIATDFKNFYQGVFYGFSKRK